MGYFYGKDTLATSLPPQSESLVSQMGQSGNQQETYSSNLDPCQAECERAYRECMRNPGREDICDSIRERCTEKCKSDGGGTCVQGKQCAGDGDCGGKPGSCVGRKVDEATKRITPGKCNCSGAPPTPDVNCPEGKGKTYEGCGCGEEYPTKTGKCTAGYVYERHPFGEKGEGTIGLCVCQKALDEWKSKHKGDLGEYNYPAGMRELMALLLGRGKELMGMPLGFSQEAQDALFGRGFENVRAQQRPAQEQLTEGLSRQGMLGTGAALGRQSDLAWNSENSITDLARQLFVANEEKKKSDLLGYTGAASDLLGRGMGYEQLLEAINSGRRGEANQALMLLLQLLSQFGG